MAPIAPRGNPDSKIWVIMHEPYWDQDKSKGYIFSGSYGYIFDKMMKEAGIYDYYVTSRIFDPDHKDTYRVMENELRHHVPKIILADARTTAFFCSETSERLMGKNKSPQDKQTNLEKYSGSLLCAPDFIKYPHYVIPFVPPDIVARDWSLRDIVCSLDLGKAKSELDYFTAHGSLEPLPVYDLEYDYESPGQFDRLISDIEDFGQAPILSVDIESTYPKATSAVRWHPGEITTIGIADSSTHGISFRLFRENKQETVRLWRSLAEVLRECGFILGQNFFNFDAPRLSCIGFEIRTSRIIDTMIRQHILWPELPKKLQFLTKQYTRQPFYKDEGHNWNMKDMQRLKHYNCLDVCVTYAVYEAQEREFNERPHLR